MALLLQDFICIKSQTFGVSEMVGVCCLPPDHQEGIFMDGNL
jgi:hypothetical protein